MYTQIPRRRFYVELGSPQGSWVALGRASGAPEVSMGETEGSKHEGIPPGGRSRAPPRSKMNVLGTHGFAVCAPNVTNDMVIMIFKKVCVFVE